MRQIVAIRAFDFNYLRLSFSLSRRKHGFKSPIRASQFGRAPLVSRRRVPAHGDKPWAGPSIATLVSLGDAGRAADYVARAFLWAAVFYHAGFARMRVGAHCFWKFRPA